ncbi:MAG: SIMPL domain-containing protein [Minwuia sp.]|uniref:SIMPL domain-containing protein n=1 Tax=Minwuia sp. TaxID=2493630 RepID=UPI003A878EA3
MPTPSVRHLAAALVLSAAALSGSAAMAHDTEPGQLHIAVEGTASATPDLANLTAGVVAEAKTAAEAMADQRERMTRVMEAIRKAGIADKDIQTSGINLSPVYARDEGRNQVPRIAGYRAANRVNVTVREMAKVGPGLDALVNAGVNDIGQVSFGFSNTEKLMEAARTDAIEKLTARRDFFAEKAGLKLGRLISLSESGGGRPPMPMMAMDRAESMRASATPVAPGESEIRVGLNAVYQILE